MQQLHADKSHIKAELQNHLKKLEIHQSLFKNANINIQSLIDVLDVTYEAISPFLPRGQVKEYELIQSIFTPLDITFSKDSNLALFQRHFLLFFMLHNINLHSNKIGVFTSPLNIDIYLKNTACNSTVSKEENKKVTSYYLDIANYLTATKETVTDLLTHFWQLYNNDTHTQEDLATLNIEGPEEDINYTAIVNSYRRQASKHHPDKGGDPSQFNKIKEAYMRLKKQYMSKERN